MKTLLTGGPLDGKIINTRKNQFAYLEVMEVTKDDKVVEKQELGWYWNRFKQVHHPCKKRGCVRVFEFHAKRS